MEVRPPRQDPPERVHQKSYEYILHVQAIICWDRKQLGKGVACNGIYAMPVHLRQARNTAIVTLILQNGPGQSRWPARLKALRTAQSAS